MKSTYSFRNQACFFLLMGGLLLLSLNGCQKATQARIDKIEPFAAQIGQPIVIQGEGLNYRSSLNFGDYLIEESELAGDNKELTMLVPEGFSVGKYDVFIETEEGMSNRAEFEVLPSLLDLSPALASVGENITFSVNFDLRNPTVVFAPGIEAKELSVSGGRTLRVKVPEGALSGPLEVTSDGGISLIYEELRIKGTPAITDIDFTWGWVGREIHVQGTNFFEGETQVIFTPNLTATLNQASFDELRFNVPPGAETGWVSIVNQYGADSLEFVIKESPTSSPFINQISPSRIAAGCVMTIRGGNFKQGEVVVSIPGENGPILLAGPVITVSDYEDRITFTMPGGSTSGDLKVSTTQGESEANSIWVHPRPKVLQVFPRKNDLGGQVTLYVEDGAEIERVRFGSISITSANVGWSHYVVGGSNDEIIATNVPMNAQNSLVPVFLELSEGCYSDSLLFEVETGKVSPNAPLAGGPNTVVIPNGLGGITNVNNDWARVSGDFRNAQNISTGLETFFFCLCEEDDGDVLIFDVFGDCNTGSVPLCRYSPEFLGEDPIGIVKKDGSIIRVEGRFIGRFDDRYEEYGSATMILTPWDYGDQIELVKPGFISEASPLSGPRGTEVTFTGRFGEPSVSGRQIRKKEGWSTWYKYFPMQIEGLGTLFPSCTIPDSALAGPFSVRVSDITFATLQLSYTVIVTAKLNFINASPIVPGTQVTISGDFPPVPIGESYDYEVEMYHAPSDSYYWFTYDNVSETELKFTQNSNLTPGIYTLKVSLGTDFYAGPQGSFEPSYSNAITVQVQ
ncbi:MAG: IPT/TIG domain-containing protein [Bacteroidota bacterium]